MLFARLSLGLATALAASSVLGQDTGKVVDFEAKATTVKSLLAQLSKQTGVALSCSNQVQNDVVLLRARGQSLDALMAKLAEVTTSRWERSGNGFNLNRDLDKVKIEDAKYLDYRAHAILQELDKSAQELKKQGGFDANKAANDTSPGRASIETNENGKTTQFRLPNPNEAPIGRALMRILASLNARDLAAIPEGSRNVFATNPTRMQRPMPAAANPALQTFLQEQEAYVRAAGQPESGNSGSEILFLGGESRPLSFQGGFGKALLIFYRAPGQEGLQVELKIADSTGTIRASHSKYLGPRGDSRKAGQTPAGAAGESPIAISDLSKQIAEALGGPIRNGQGDTFSFTATSGGGGVMRVVGSPFGAPQATKPLTKELQAWFSRPDQNDPLSSFVAELITGLDASGSLVALLPDSLLMPLASLASKPLKPSELRELLSREQLMAVRQDGGWTVVQPQYPSLARIRRVDRTAFSNMLRAIEKDGMLSLDTAAAYASGRTQPMASGIESQWVNLAYPHAAPAFSNAIGSWRMYQFYAVLDPGRRAMLRDRGEVAVGGPSVNQQAALSTMVFHDPMGPSRRQIEAPMPTQGAQRQRTQVATRSIVATGSDAMEFMPMFDLSMNLSDERTEMLPNGLNPNGVAKLNGDVQEGLYATQSSGGGRFFTAQEYGMYMGLAGGPAGQYFPQYSHFRPARITRMNFMFELSDIATLAKSLTEEAVDLKQQAVAWNLVNPAIRRAAEEHKAQMDNANRKMDLRIGGVAIPPPPAR
ncbi:MAG: hypothetical protein HZC36_04670 [Armatimonadetes bacterium]|nr:hypothetical protein [Armatimonadota bacterium]